jgi:16S rRNA (guanine527-N7)-methyltransferase
VWRADPSAKTPPVESSSNPPDRSTVIDALSDVSDQVRCVPRPVATGLIEVLEESRRLGFLGGRPVADVIEHARSFVENLEDVGSDMTILDMGSGGGVPGLVIAHDLADVSIVLLDRRRTRTDFLERVTRRLGWFPRVDVIVGDAAQPPPQRAESFDRAVARGFGPPVKTLTTAVRWVRVGGEILISEPPDGDRWNDVDLSPLGVERLPSTPSIARFVRRRSA